MVKPFHVLMACLCVACGDGRVSAPTPTAPTQSTAGGFNGTWTGGFDTPIRFVVQDGILTSFSITFSLNPPGTSPCTNTHTVTPGVSIAGSTFSFSADVRSSLPPTGFELFTSPVTGTFANETSGSVTIGRAGSSGGGLYAYLYGVQCGTTVTTVFPTNPVTIAVNRS